ncbi:MAG: UDP-3-O-(3-hydroxymyristoyl)glucosamine N-acyltransferase [Rhodospirillaceae bacterium]|nr:UDP-3-O-(3-hydroxymyristoyl)glucosamine N-acyltransferase [Rhodospirillaceae bacterium]
MPLLAPPKSLTLLEIAHELQAEAVGDVNFSITAVAHPVFAQHHETLALAMDKGSYALLKSTHAGAAIVSKGMEVDLDQFAGGVVITERYRVALAWLTQAFSPRLHFVSGIHPSAVVDPSAKIGDGASVGPLCVIGSEARIGANAVLLSQVTIATGAEVGTGSLLHPGARVGDNCLIGNDCILHHNVSIGADGFGFVTSDEGSIERAQKTGKITAFNHDIRRINSLGNVIIGDSVEIGAGSCVDRGTLGPTRIGNGTKIDNLVQIGHNVTIGENVLIAGGVGIAGSARVGDRVVIGGNAGIGDHKSIGDDAIVAGMSGVITDLEPGTVYAGYPARPIKETQRLEINKLRTGKALRDLSSLVQRVDKLEKQAEKRREQSGDVE